MKKINVFILTLCFLNVSLVLCNDDSLLVKKQGYMVCIYSDLPSYSQDLEPSWYSKVYFLDTFTADILNGLIFSDSITLNASRIFDPFSLLHGSSNPLYSKTLRDFLSLGLWDSTEKKKLIFNSENNFIELLNFQTQELKNIKGLKVFVWKADLTLLEINENSDKSGDMTHYILFNHSTNNYELLFTAVIPKFLDEYEIEQLNMVDD